MHVVPNAMLHATEMYTQLLDDTSAAGACGVMVVAVSRAEKERKVVTFDGCRMLCSRVPSKNAPSETRCVWPCVTFRGESINGEWVGNC